MRNAAGSKWLKQSVSGTEDAEYMYTCSRGYNTVSTITVAFSGKNEQSSVVRYIRQSQRKDLRLQSQHAVLTEPRLTKTPSPYTHAHRASPRQTTAPLTRSSLLLRRVKVCDGRKSGTLG